MTIPAAKFAEAIGTNPAKLQQTLAELWRIGLVADLSWQKAYFVVKPATPPGYAFNLPGEVIKSNEGGTLVWLRT
jgi:hypothetical protein